MKNLFILLSVICFGLCGLQANALTVVNKDMGYVSVNATASKEIVPDTASIYFTVETSATDSKVAVNKNKEITDKLILELKQVLSIEKTDSIQTKNFYLKPNYSYDKNGKKTFVNYTAANRIFVKTHNLQNVGKLIDIAANNNATNVDELNFYIENEKKYAGELAQEAISKAKVLAQLTATTLNQKVDGVKSIIVNISPENNYSGRNIVLSSKAKTSNSAKTHTPVEFGKIKLQAVVSAEFYVK